MKKSLKAFWGIIKKHRINLIFSGLFLISCLIKTYTYMGFTLFDPNRWESLNNFVLTSLICLITVSLVFIFTSKKLPLVLLVIDLIFSALLVGDIIFSKYYGEPITIKLVYQYKLLFVKNMSTSVENLYDKKQLMLLLSGIIFAGAVIVNRFVLKNKPEKVPFVKRAALSILVLGLSFGGCVYYVHGVNLTAKYSDKGMMVKEYGIYLYHGNDIYHTVADKFVSKKLTPAENQELTTYYENKLKDEKKVKESKHYGIAKGKNLIAVQLESFQQFIIGTKFRGQEITPNLNKLIKKGLYFDSVFQQTGFGNTSDAERLFHTSMFAAESASANYLYPYNTQHSFAGQLQELGYSTTAFHAFDTYFWNRNICYPGYGFEKFVCGPDFERGDVRGWGLDDHGFFKQSIDRINTDNPFYGFMISLTSHHPFSHVLDYPFDKGEFDGKTMGDYLQIAKYVDDAIGDLIKELKQKRLYKNTIIVFYGDHKAFPAEELDQVLQVNGKGIDKGDSNEYKFEESLKIPFIIANSGVKSREIKTVMGQIDMMPTLAALMGVDMPYALGRDILSVKRQDGYAVQRNGSVITPNKLMLPDKRVFDRSSGKELNSGEESEVLDKYLLQLNISDLILKKDAFSQFTIPGLEQQ